MANDLALTRAVFDTTAQKFGASALASGYGKVPTGLIASAPWAVGVYFKINAAVSATQVMVGATQCFWLGLNANGTLHGEFGGESGFAPVTANSSVAVSTGVWHFATISISANTMTVTLDGAIIGVVSTASTQARYDTAGDGGGHATGYFCVGSHGGYEAAGTFEFKNGALDEVAVWRSDKYPGAFTVPTAPYTGIESGLLALWHLDGNGADSVSAAATAYTLTGPISGAVGAASLAFTVTASGTLGNPAIVTPSDAGGSGGFAPTTITLAAGNNSSATFTYTPGSAGAKTISTTNGGGLTNPSAIIYTASAAATATAYTLTGPTSSIVGQASAPFTVTSNGSLASPVSIGIADNAPGGSFNPSSVTLPAGTNTSAMFTYLADSVGAKTVTTSNTVSLIDPPGIPFIASDNSGTVAPNSAAIVYSPGTWLVGTGSAKTVNAGAYFRMFFTGGQCTLNFDLMNNRTPLPQICYRIDGVDWTQATLASAIALSMPASTVAWPRHHLEVVVKSTSEFLNFGAGQGGSRWSPQNTAVTLTGITLAAGQSVSTPTALGQSVWIFGDSIVEGYHTVSNAGSGAQDTDGSDARLGWAFIQRELLGAEVAIIGFGGAGISATGVLGVPGLAGSYNLLWAGQARNFTPAPDLIVIAYGENDGTSVGDSTFIANYKAAVAGLLAATPSSTRIACLVPFSQRKAVDIVAALTQLGSARVTRIDTAGLFNTVDSVDGQHPLGVANLAAIGPAVANKLRPLVQGVRNRWVRA